MLLLHQLREAAHCKETGNVSQDGELQPSYLKPGSLALGPFALRQICVLFKLFYMLSHIVPSQSQTKRYVPNEA